MPRCRRSRRTARRPPVPGGQAVVARLAEQSETTVALRASVRRHFVVPDVVILGENHIPEVDDLLGLKAREGIGACGNSRSPDATVRVPASVGIRSEGEQGFRLKAGRYLAFSFRK